MSKEKDNIIQALDNIATAFDEYGFEPTIPTTENYEHFNEWFLLEIEMIKSNAIKQDQKIDQLKQQLAEKDEEIESFKDFISCKCIDVIKKSYENQIQFAIQELEKLKEILSVESENNPIVYGIDNDVVGGALDREKTFEIIDKQIKELKGE